MSREANLPVEAGILNILSHLFNRTAMQVAVEMEPMIPGEKPTRSTFNFSVSLAKVVTLSIAHLNYARPFEKARRTWMTLAPKCHPLDVQAKDRPTGGISLVGSQGPAGIFYNNSLAGTEDFI